MHQTQIQANFSKAAKDYSAHAKVQQEIGRRLMQRFDYYKLKPERALDLGAGTGYFSQQLKKRFNQCQVVAFDLSESMLKKIKKGILKPVSRVKGCMTRLPFKTNSYDIVFANQVIHWHADYLTLFKEIARVLKPSGVFVFSTLGPDTFIELKQAWAEVDEYQHAYSFVDMHLLGDALLKAGMAEPVVDMEYLTARYQEIKTLARDLKAQGVQHNTSRARQGLTTPSQWSAFSNAYDKYRDEDGLLPLSYEVIYGQAWGQALQQSLSANGEVVVPIAQLKK